MTSTNKIWKELTSIWSNLDNFHSLEVVDRVSETQLQLGENSNWIIWRLKGNPEKCLYIQTMETKGFFLLEIIINDIGNSLSGSRHRDTTSGEWKFQLNYLAVKELNDFARHGCPLSWDSVVLMLIQNRRQWTNVETTVGATMCDHSFSVSKWTSTMIRLSHFNM